MTDRRKSGISLAFVCAALAVSLALASMTAGFGTRWGWWDFRKGLTLLRWVVYGELATALASLLGCLIAASRASRGAAALFFTGFLISAAAVSVPLRMALVVRRVPPIHDITTDTENPPGFDAILALRRDAPNTTKYGGPSLADQQRRAYPDIAPLMLEIPPARVFEHSLAVAKETGWEIVQANPAEGRIEATDTTFWFGFKDDIAIRVSPQEKGSRIDIRSVSRVGKSDVGANAARIHKFLKSLRNRAIQRR